MNAEDLIGKVIGTCTLQKLLRQGNMNAVYLAQQTRPRRQVAVKVLLPTATVPSNERAAFLECFRRMSDIAACLVHPNILECYEYGEQDGLAYIVMPYLSGGSLRTLVEQQGPFTYHVAVNYLDQLASALDYAHQRGVIHGNVQPPHILVASDGHLVLSYFSLLALCRNLPTNLDYLTATWSHGLFGSPDYMAPELLKYKAYNEISSQSDQYALAVILFEMLTGTTTPSFQSPGWMFRRTVTTPTLRQWCANVPSTAEHVLLRALSSQPQERYKTASEFAQAFRTALGSLATSPKTVEWAEGPILATPPPKTVKLTETSIAPVSGNTVPVAEQPTLRLESKEEAARQKIHELAVEPAQPHEEDPLHGAAEQYWRKYGKSDIKPRVEIPAEVIAQGTEAIGVWLDTFGPPPSPHIAEPQSFNVVPDTPENPMDTPLFQDLMAQGDAHAISAYLKTANASPSQAPEPKPLNAVPNVSSPPSGALSSVTSKAQPAEVPPKNVWQELGVKASLENVWQKLGVVDDLSHKIPSVDDRWVRVPEPKVIEGHATKLIFVGEGGMGKSSLLRALHQQVFDPALELTHGIQVGTLRLPYPDVPNLQLTFYTWDFGGQEIYQATHQLFLTRRSVYLLVWNARQGLEVCRVRFWLDTISTLAPDAPILLVATHADQLQPHIDLPYYQKIYPQLVGQCVVSNKKGNGIDILKQQIAEIASHTPLVRTPRPFTYDHAASALLTRPEHWLDRATFLHICRQYDINSQSALTHFGPYLHDLGKMLFFADDPLLSNLIVLRPQWISQAVSAILDDPQVKQAGGLLQHRDLPRIWATDADGQPYDPALYPAFLRLMERFDLCYQLEPERPGGLVTHSLIPLLLPEQQPATVPQPPRTTSADIIRAEIRYTLDFVPAGLMSWFLVRTHRYSQQQHWRTGAHLAYQGQQAHIELDLHRREIQLLAWGTFPYTFFLILKDTLDTLLARFQNLRVKREIPCACQLQQQHPHLHEYDVLESQFRRGETEITCQQGERLPLLYLLYGLHAGSTAQVAATVQQTQAALMHTSLSSVEIQRALTRIEQGQQFLWRDVMRELTHLSTFEMQKELAPCPSLFVLERELSKIFKLADVTSRPYRLRLLCQYPAGPHTLAGEQGYELRESKEWWKTMSPWLRRLVTVLKTGGSLGKAVGAVFDQADVDRFANQIDLFNEILNDLPAIEALESVSQVNDGATSPSGQHVEGAALRALAAFLETADPAHHWHGLQRVVTEDRRILWVCPQHTHIGMPF